MTYVDKTPIRRHRKVVVITGLQVSHRTVCGRSTPLRMLSGDFGRQREARKQTRRKHKEPQRHQQANKEAITNRHKQTQRQPHEETTAITKRNTGNHTGNNQ